MAADYQRICAANIKQYGEGTSHLELLGALYSERTHFVFELLQNAEDASATILEFRLWEDRLEVLHDGRVFDENDVRGICGVCDGTKARDLTKIGKFGIGFKSVYAYVDQPEIHSGDEHFRIDLIVRPKAVARRNPEKDFTTLFILPLGGAGVPASKAFAEILAALQNLKTSSLLFLRNIKRVIAKRGVQEVTRLTRQITEQPNENIRQIALEVNRGLIGKKHWLIFQHPVVLKDEKGVEVLLRVEIAFQLERDSIVPVEQSMLFAFFPTEKLTRLGFLIQGPYRTTPARDNVREDDPTNRLLVQETATLLVDALRWLKNNNRLTVKVLECLPIDRNDFPQSGLLRQIYEAVRNAFQNEAFVPTFTEGQEPQKYEKCSMVVADGSGNLRDFVGTELLSTLTGSKTPLSWLSSHISNVRTPKLYSYLRYELHVKEYDEQDFLQLLTPKFLSEKTDEWMIDLYAFLEGMHAGMYSPPLSAPKIIRLEDGTHICPFKADGSPAAFLPSETRKDLTCVKQTIAKASKTKHFFSRLGYIVPDECDDVMVNLLPKYDKGNLPTSDEYERDMSRIIGVLKNTVSGTKKLLFSERLKSLRFLRAINATTGKQAAKRPSETYFCSPELEVYFQGNPECWFVARELEKHKTILSELGVKKNVRVIRRKTSPNGHVVITDSRGNHERGLNGFDPACSIDGLRYAIQHPNPARSAVIWNHVISRATELIHGIIESSTYQNYRGAKQREAFSEIGDLLSQSRWLPASNGQWRKPSEISFQELTVDFRPNETLAHKLRMKTLQNAVVLNLAREVGVSPEDIELLKKLKMHTGLWEQCKQEMANSRGNSGHDGNAGHEAGTLVDFTTQFENAFERAGPMRPASPTPTDSPITNATFRRGRTREELEAAQSCEAPLGERVRRVITSVWESKSAEVREFLKHQYDGHCQICDHTFRKRDGGNYFEARYIVSRAEEGAGWCDRPGNVLCLCATCLAKLQHGSIESPDNIVKQLRDLKLSGEGNGQPLRARIRLCHEEVTIRFTERHLLDLQEMLSIGNGKNGVRVYP